MILKNNPQNIIDYVSATYPEVEYLLKQSKERIPFYKGAMQPYQAACLYYLAKQYENVENASILEVGTGLGYSTYFLASALPDKQVVTLNPSAAELKIARNNLMTEFQHIVFLPHTSRQYFEAGHTFDFIFIDADHKDIKFDLQWYSRLNDKGTIVFHDYSNEDSKSQCLPVYNAINNMLLTGGDLLGEFIEIVDNENNYGMAGWHKHS